MGRLFTDELEEIEDGHIEAMETTGTGKSQVITFGMLSQVRTSFIAWTLYIFEINVRQAVTLGLLGGGGIGQFIEVQQGLRAFGDMMAGIVVVLVLIIAVEMISQRIRSYLRAEDEAEGLIALSVPSPQRMAESGQIVVPPEQLAHRLSCRLKCRSQTRAPQFGQLWLAGARSQCWQSPVRLIASQWC